MRTEKQKRAKVAYQSTQRKLQISLYPKDADIEEHIDRLGGKYSAYIRELIRRDMKEKEVYVQFAQTNGFEKE